VFTTASIGIALSTTGYDKPEDLLRDADVTMYQAKAQGTTARYEVFIKPCIPRQWRCCSWRLTCGRWNDMNFGLTTSQVSSTSGRITGFEAGPWQQSMAWFPVEFFIQ